MTASINFSAGTVVTSTWLNAVDGFVFDDAINVKLYGATGDGTTDDTSALNTAIMAGLTAGKLIVVPAGTYKVTGRLTTGGTGSPSNNI